MERDVQATVHFLFMDVVPMRLQRLEDITLRDVLMIVSPVDMVAAQIIKPLLEVQMERDVLRLVSQVDMDAVRTK